MRRQLREFFSIYGDDYQTPDGTCLRDYVHVLDISRAHICALQKLNQPGMRSYNIGLGKSYSVREVHQAAEKIAGKAIPARVEKRRPGDPAVLCASPERIMKELGWKPEHSSLEEIISSAWEWKKKSFTRRHGDAETQYPREQGTGDREQGTGAETRTRQGTGRQRNCNPD